MPISMWCLYMVQPNNRELFCLRLLLLHVKGATSFESLRTYDNTVYPTFYDAAFGRGLLDSNDVWDTILKETAEISTPKQLRELFILIIVYNTPSKNLELWEKYKSCMIQDYTRRYQNGSDSDYYHLALAEIHAGLALHAYDSSYLPEPDLGIVDRFASVSNAARLSNLSKQYEKDGTSMMHQLNEDQKAIFDRIMSAARRVRMETDYKDHEYVDADTMHRSAVPYRMSDNEVHDDLLENGYPFYFVDGPGGTGKTFCTIVL